MNEFPAGSELRKILRKFSKERVEKFLVHLFIIWEVTPQMQHAATRKERLGRLKQVATATATFMDVLESRGGMLDAENEERPTVGAFLWRAEQAGGLRELLAILEACYTGADAVDDPEMTAVVQHGDPAKIAALLCARERRAQRLIDCMSDKALPLNDADMKQIAAAIKSRRPIIPHIEALRIAALTAVRALREAVKAEVERTGTARAGRKSADKEGMLTETAHAWARILGEPPTVTREGPFYELAAALTGTAAPDRPVAQAVQAVRDEANRAPDGPQEVRVYVSAAQLTGQATLDQAIDRAKEKQRN